jgi:hypothetical protein
MNAGGSSVAAHALIPLPCGLAQPSAQDGSCCEQTHRGVNQVQRPWRLARGQLFLSFCPVFLLPLGHLALPWIWEGPCFVGGRN